MEKLKFMPEYHSTCIWIYNEDGLYVPIDNYSILKLPKDTINKLEEFDLDIMNILDWNDPGAISPMTYEERVDLFQNGKKLFAEVQSYLKDTYEIIDALDWINSYHGEDKKMNKEETINKFIELFPQKKKALVLHYQDYQELLFHVFLSEEINIPLLKLLEINKDEKTIQTYCTFLETMWKCGDDEVVNGIDVTILERLSDDVIVWKRFGNYISEAFKNYINEEVLKQNILMIDIEKLSL